MSKKFQTLDYSRGWDDYWRDHPQGYSPQEQMINWSGQLNAMIDFFNEYFDVDLSEYATDVMEGWYFDGRLDDIINEALFDSKADKTTVNSLIDSNPILFKGDKTGVIPINSLLNDNISQAITERRKIKIPAGVYVVDGPITSNLSSVDLIIEGEGKGEHERITKILWRGGANTMFNFSNARNIIFRNIEISGYDYSVDDDVLSVGSKAFDVDGSMIFDNVSLMGFDIIAEWRGGYYHRFSNCHIKFTKQGFKNFNANNLRFDNCKVADIERLVTLSGGSGTITFSGGSIERFANTPFAGVSGAAPNLFVIGSWFENYPNTTPPSGISGTYSDQYVMLGFSCITLLGNTFATNGIRRVIFGTSVLKSVVSLGNRIEYAPTSAYLEFFMSTNASVETIIANDIAIDNLVQAGTYTPQYVNSPSLIQVKDASSIYDPFLKRNITPVPSWINATLENGWLQNTGEGATIVAYRRIKNTVYGKGFVIGTSATDPVIFRLPEGYRPTAEYHRFIGVDAANTVLRLRITTTGAVRVDNDPYTVNNLSFTFSFELT